MDIAMLKLKLNKNKFIRAFFWPYKRLKGRLDHARYLRSGQSEKIRVFKGCHAGETCFIIGNGPSLTSADLESIKGHVSFASNRIYKLFDKTDWRPTYWMCIDKSILCEDAKIIHSIGNFICFISSAAQNFGVKAASNIYYIFVRSLFYIKNYGTNFKVGFSEHMDIASETGYSVTYDAIQMAVYMGFRKIYLLGVDHNYSRKLDEKGCFVIDPAVKDYFGDMKMNSFGVQNYSVTTRAYEAARDYCEKNEIEIRNATRGGKLEVFKRVNFEDVLAELSNKK